MASQSSITQTTTVNINKLLKDFPRLMERVEALENAIRDNVALTNLYPRVDTGTQVPVTLAPAVSERSQAVTRGAGIGERETRNKRGSTRRN
jgi:hypothetical protein